MKKGKIIILDGSPSVGKTTIALSIQENKEEPFLYAGIDSFVQMFPSKWISFNPQSMKPEGLEFVFTKDKEGQPVIRFATGQYGERLIHGYINAIKGLAAAGNNVIADGVITKKEWLEYMHTCLEGFACCYVGLYAPLKVLEAREARRFEPKGVARGRFDDVYSLKKQYDLFIDTSKTKPEKAAKQILEFLKHNRE
jgi:chloramphenicol 3-O phosphotransferase